MARGSQQIRCVCEWKVERGLLRMPVGFARRGGRVRWGQIKKSLDSRPALVLPPWQWELLMAVEEASALSLLRSGLWARLCSGTGACMERKP